MTTTHRSHPNYLAVGVALIVLTILEVMVVGMPVPPLPFLLLFGGAKGLLIAMYFMHLRFDRKLFSVLFSIGVAGGIAMVSVLIYLLGGYGG